MLHRLLKETFCFCNTLSVNVAIQFFWSRKFRRVHIISFKVRTSNPRHNACIFSITHLWRLCKLNIPEMPEMPDTGNSYLNHFMKWLRIDTSELKSPYQALGLFSREFLPNNHEDVRATTQDARLFFNCMAGESKFNGTPLQEFDFMQPIHQER